MELYKNRFLLLSSSLTKYRWKGFGLDSSLLCWRVSHSVTHKHELWIWFPLSYAMMKALLRLAAVRDTKEAGELRGDTVHFIASSSARFFYDAKRQHLSTIKTDGDLSFTIIQQQTYRRKQLMDQADDNSLTALLTKREQVRFCAGFPQMLTRNSLKMSSKFPKFHKNSLDFAQSSM